MCKCETVAKNVRVCFVCSSSSIKITIMAEISSGHVIQCGQVGDIPLVGNFFGDGLRLAVFRPEGGMWFIKGKGNGNWGLGGEVQFQFGQRGDIPFAANVFGDGVRAIVFRPTGGLWFIKALGPGNWGGQGDVTLQCG